MNTLDVLHRVQVNNGLVVTAVRERIERVLSVKTNAVPEGHVWAIYFHAPKDVNLDFLKPDILPPKNAL